MQKIISSLSGITYQQAIKPLLFRRQPDDVHERLLKMGVRIQRNGLTRHLLSRCWAYNNQPYLAQQVCGIAFSNPVGLSAGFDKDCKLPPLLKSIGFGFMEAGSFTYEQCDGNPRPWFYRLPKTKSLIVHAGLANQGVRDNVSRICGYPAGTFADFPLNISVAKTNSRQAASETDAIDDYVGSLKHIQQQQVGDMLTLNISCPNTYGGEPFTTPQKLDRLLRRVDALKLTQPVFVKMPIDLTWEAFDDLLIVIVNHNVAGVTIGNLAKDRAKLDLKDPLPDGVRGGLSGKPTWKLSNNLIRSTYKKYGEQLVIIGVGGIFSAKDAYTKIKLGATLVELITGMIFEGPQLIGQINHGLAELLKRDGYTSISEAIGVDA